jgi:hypothetical protein
MFSSKFKNSLLKAQVLVEFEKSKFLELKKIKENLNLLSVSDNLKLMEITRRLFNDGKLLRPMVGYLIPIHIIINTKPNIVTLTLHTNPYIS